MDKKYYIKRWKRITTLYLLFFMGTIALKAQINPNTYYTSGWQFDFPLKSNTSSTMNDLGIYVEAGYYFTPQISLGGFVNINTLNEETTLDHMNSEISKNENIKETFSYINIPLGASLRYRFTDKSWWHPYLSIKTGINYAQAKSISPLGTYNDCSCGFYTSPEFGINIFPFKQYILGVNFAIYYTYATNKYKISNRQENGIKSMGVRLGLTF